MRQQKNGYSLGNDAFVWSYSDIVKPDGTSAGFDRIRDFVSGDRLDFTDVLGGRTASDAHDMLHVTDTSAGTVVSVSFDAGVSFCDVVLLEGQHGLDLDQMMADGCLMV
jgi:hypothetical protein